MFVRISLIFLALLVYFSVKTSASLKQELKLLTYFNTVINENAVYLEELKLYFNNLKKSHNYSRNSERSSIKAFLDSKRLLIDWKNFLSYSQNSKNLKNLVDKYGKVNDELSQYTDTDDPKLKLFILNLIHVKDFQNVSFLVKDFKANLKNMYNRKKFELNREEDYKALCRGEGTVNPDATKNLKCTYFHDDPFFLIGPGKKETLSLEPPIFIFYDAVSDSEIKSIKNVVANDILSTTQGRETSYRVAKVKWISYNKVEKLRRRTEILTGLSLRDDTAEPPQIANYGIGGHYGLHVDDSGLTTPIDEGRIATVLYYLNDARRGGATVLPRLNLTVFPKKGAALFWYNIKPTYELDVSLAHAACPLYLGTKWVLNIWIWLKGQYFTKPCLKNNLVHFEDY